MAYSALTIELDETLASRVRYAADEAGLTPEAYAAEALARAVGEDRWAESRRRLEAYDRGEVEAVDLEVALAEFQKAFDDAVAKRK